MLHKGIIVEIKNKYSIVMTSESTILRIQNKDNMKVGQQIYFTNDDLYVVNKSKVTFLKTFSPILAVAAVFMFLFITPTFKNTVEPYSLVSFDLNPSIQIELDENKKIIKASGMNDDGTKMNLKPLLGTPLNEGTLKLKEILENNGYILENDSILLGFTFLGTNENSAYEEDIKTIFANNFTETKILYLKGSKETLKQANSQGISLGRYEAELNIDDDLIEEKIEAMSVEEIIRLLNGTTGVLLNEDVLEDLEDELEDRLDESEPTTSDDSDDNDNDSDDDNDDDNDDSDNNEADDND